MPFTDDQRNRITRTAATKYVSYWHAMHPVTFKPKELYRAAWNDDVWDACKLLMKEREETINTAYSWTYSADFSGYLNRPDWIPARPKLTFRFKNKKHMPFTDVTEEDVGDEVAMQMRKWIAKAYKFRAEKQLLHTQLRRLVARQHSHYDGNNREVKVATVNTPRILHRVWPEVIPFLSEYERGEVRKSRSKCPTPRNMNEEAIKAFHADEGMEELNHALLAVGMIDDCTDKKYPEFSGR